LRASRARACTPDDRSRTFTAERPKGRFLKHEWETHVG
jgi:hypothetical protein